MQKIKFFKRYLYNCFSNANPNDKFYTTIIEQYPFVKGFITRQDWYRYFGISGGYLMNEMIYNYNLTKKDGYYIGKITKNDLNLIKFYNGLYCVYGKVEDFEIIEKVVNLPDELFKM